MSSGLDQQQPADPCPLPPKAGCLAILDRRFPPPPGRSTLWIFPTALNLLPCPCVLVGGAHSRWGRGQGQGQTLFFLLTVAALLLPEMKSWCGPGHQGPVLQADLK